MPAVDQSALAYPYPSQGTNADRAGFVLHDMAKDPAFLFYSADFIVGTSFMTFEEKGAYIHVLCAQHQHGPLSEKKIITLIGEKLWGQIKEKFKQSKEGLYYNKRLSEEAEKRSKYCDSRRSNRLKSKIKDKKHMSQHMSGHMEDEDENKDSSLTLKKGEYEGETWRTCFKEYQTQAKAALKDLLADRDWVRGRMQYHPNVNIKKSLQKAWEDYWATEAGWKNKKSKRTNVIDWKATASNALSQRMNIVWLDKSDRNETEIYTEAEAKEKGYI